MTVKVPMPKGLGNGGYPPRREPKPRGMRRLLIRLLDRYCAECWGLIWPWQPRCGQRHTNCKHLADLAAWERNDYRVTPWACSYCGRRITELA